MEKNCLGFACERCLEIVKPNMFSQMVVNTLPKTNIALENRPSQRETSIPTIHFQVRAVSFSWVDDHPLLYGNNRSLHIWHICHVQSKKKSPRRHIQVMKYQTLKGG